MKRNITSQEGHLRYCVLVERAASQALYSFYFENKANESLSFCLSCPYTTVSYLEPMFSYIST